MARRFDIAGAILAIAMLAACAGSPPQRLYTLGNPSPAPMSPAVRASAAPALLTVPFSGVVRLTSVTIPEMVDRPQLVLRAGANQVVVLDNERWAESLKTGVARVLAADLSAQLGGATVLGRSDRSSRDAASIVSVTIDISRLDASLQDGVRLDASWSVRVAAVDGAGAPAGNAAGVASTGAVQVHEPAAGPGIAAAVAAHDRALAQVGAAVASDVRRAIVGGRKDAAGLSVR